MAMEINATLMVQVINFFVAYFLLRTLLFKPAVKALQEEHFEQDNIKSIIVEREKKLENTFEKKKLAWIKSQEQFDYAKPKIEEGCLEQIEVQPAKEPELLSDKQIENLAKDFSQIIVEKVSDVTK